MARVPRLSIIYFVLGLYIADPIEFCGDIWQNPALIGLVFGFWFLVFVRKCGIKMAQACQKSTSTGIQA